MEKLIKVIVDNSRVMDSIENAHITVTSPTGKTITLDKIKIRTASPELREIFWKCCGDPYVKFIGTVELTKEEMALALKFSNLNTFKTLFGITHNS